MRYRLIASNFPDSELAAIHDTLTWLRLLLQADGHQVERGEGPTGYWTGPCRNVVLENFFGWGSMLGSMLPGTDWVCVASEFPTGERLEAFQRVAQSATQIWLTSDDDRYADLFPGKTIRVLPFPCLPGFVRTPEKTRDIDVLFIGRITEYRKYVLQKIKAAGVRVLVLSENDPPMIRNGCCAQAKVGIVLPETALGSRSSDVPLWNYLQQGLCVACQQSERPVELDDVAGSVGPDAIVERCLSLVDTWQIEGPLQQFLFWRQKPKPLNLPEARHVKPAELVIPWA